MSLVRASVLLLAIALLAGCGGGSVPVTPPQPPQAKTMLLEVAAHGQINSGIMAVRENLEQMKATDPNKAQTLLRDLDQLERMNSPQQIKAKAKEMADKL
jgi:hypothetical protein